jgi:F1F0 ATPase subunit 2
MDSSPLVLALSALAGIILGILYFGGLWLTITKMRTLKNPGIFLTLSFILRTVIVIGGFYLISAGHLERLAVAMLAFFVTRFVFIKYFSPERSDEQQRGVQSKGDLLRK